ncbi:hypothetical protein [Metasolibacillus meyeri]|uniref:hypothetical protein n=1 Tax=Metasolibacillus meyeri TaxID=1071052 RepID=UPI000D30BD65|nr:hypothetical protein [Metasolibacillus meyeri]
MEKLTPEQTENCLKKLSDLLNYLNDEDIIFEFDSSLIDRLIRCYEVLKVKCGDIPNEQTERLERYSKWYLKSLTNELDS